MKVGCSWLEAGVQHAGTPHAGATPCWVIPGMRWPHVLTARCSAHACQLPSSCQEGASLPASCHTAAGPRHRCDEAYTFHAFLIHYSSRPWLAQACLLARLHTIAARRRCDHTNAAWLCAWLQSAHWCRLAICLAPKCVAAHAAAHSSLAGLGLFHVTCRAWGRGASSAPGTWMAACMSTHGCHWATEADSHALTFWLRSDRPQPLSCATHVRAGLFGLALTQACLQCIGSK